MHLYAMHLCRCRAVAACSRWLLCSVCVCVCVAPPHRGAQLGGVRGFPARGLAGAGHGVRISQPIAYIPCTHYRRSMTLAACRVLPLCLWACTAPHCYALHAAPPVVSQHPTTPPRPLLCSHAVLTLLTYLHRFEVFAEAMYQLCDLWVRSATDASQVMPPPWHAGSLGRHHRMVESHSRLCLAASAYSTAHDVSTIADGSRQLRVHG